MTRPATAVAAGLALVALLAFPLPAVLAWATTGLLAGGAAQLWSRLTDEPLALGPGTGALAALALAGGIALLGPAAVPVLAVTGGALLARTGWLLVRSNSG